MMSVPNLALRTCAVLTFVAVAQTSAAGLQHDLFSRPSLAALKPASGEPVKTGKPADPAPEWKPELKAIITGNGTAFVNVEGRIVQMGNEIDGYRLVEVQDRRAIFVKDKVRYTLQLNAVAKPVDSASGTARPVDAPAGLGSLRAADVLSSVPVTAAAPAAPGDATRKPEPRRSPADELRASAPSIERSTR